MKIANLQPPLEGESFGEYTMRMAQVHGYSTEATIAIGDRWLQAHLSPEDLAAPSTDEAFAVYLARLIERHGHFEGIGSLAATRYLRHQEAWEARRVLSRFMLPNGRSR
jgi:hypothetical protein